MTRAGAVSSGEATPPRPERRAASQQPCQQVAKDPGFCRRDRLPGISQGFFYQDRK